MTLLNIDGTDRESYLNDYEITKTIEWYNSYGTIWLFDDTSNTLRGVLDKYQDIQLFDDDGVNMVFRGVIVDIEQEPNNNTEFVLSVQDYWYLFTRKHISKSYTNQTASYIIKDIISTYFPSDFTTTGVVTTSKLYTYKFRGVNVAKIFQELAFLEGFIIYVDTTKDLVFKAETTTSTGKEWDYDNNDIIDEKFDNVGRDLVNAVFVEGKGGGPDGQGVGAYYVDSALVSALGGKILEMPKISDSTLTTTKQCRDRGEVEVRRRNQSAPIGKIVGIKDFDVDVGKTHLLTIPHRSYSKSVFLIRTATHKYAEDTTTIDVIYTSKNNAELVSEILLQARQLQEIDTDDSTIFPKFIQSSENLVMKAYVKVDNRTSLDNYYGNNYYGSMYYGSQNNGVFNSVLAEEQITVMDQGIEAILKIFAQDSAPNDLSNPNAHLAVGNSSTALNLSDTSINGELARQRASLGSPNDYSEQMLIAHYKLNGDALDASGFGRDGTNINSVTFVTGKLDKAANFDGTTKYIDIYNSELPTLNEDFSWSIWFKITALPSSYNYIISMRNSTGSTKLSLTLLSNGRIEMTLTNDAGTTDFTYSNTIFAVDTWYKITYTWNISTLTRKLYVNGVLDVTDIVSGAFTQVFNQYQIGALGGSLTFNGLIDDVRIYNYVLSSGEITSLYNSGSGRETGVATYQIDWEFLITDDDVTAGIIRNIGLLNAASSGTLFFAGVLSSTINKIVNEEQRFTVRLTFEVDNYYLTNKGRKQFRDALIGAVSSFVDSSNARVELQTTTPFRDTMESGYPLVDRITQLLYQISLTSAEIASNSLDGETYTGVDLLDSASGGVPYFDGETGYTVDINTGEDQNIEVIINGARE